DAAPTHIGYGGQVNVESPDAESVTRGTLIRLSSATHSFNQSQVIFPLSFSPTGPTGLSAPAPESGSMAPPGPYMLFLINASGVPSMARMVTVGP
ncbi:MAG TPA: galactose oxidase early set domain-containing protein, partial [Gemmatimonadales bacterium]|nr:galactose oxidase early set domain-containing protein [Gemmatimonadales bacterium]